jgi:hypothetical protein
MSTSEDQMDKTLAQIKAAWLAYPELRLGQLLDNALARRQYVGPDMFYIRDEHLVKALREFTGALAQR